MGVVSATIPMTLPLFKPLSRAFRRSENLGPVLLAVSIGLAGGAAAILFRYLIDWTDRLFFEGGARALSFLDGAYVIILPAIGLFLVDLLVRSFAPEARGHGVPEVMYAVRKQGGRIRARVAIVKGLASALCIGSGGSVGREGPIVQAGSTLGSVAGQILGLRARRVRIAVACGAAAGIAGTFNAPIAGVLFAMEVILGSFAARAFGLVVVSSVTATALCQATLGDEPAFPLAQVFVLNSWQELPIYVVLGFLLGGLSLVYVKTLYFFETGFERWRWHPSAKAIIGGLGVGLLGFLSIQYLGGRFLFGVGYDAIEATLGLGSTAELDWGLGASMTISALLLLVVMKVAATSLTLAAGGSGGVFAPALFIGATAGGAFGLVVNHLFPGVVAPPGAYALVGMGAVFAGSAHAPITAILILFEMTDDYQIILPLMIAVVISYLVSSALDSDSIYTIKLRRRGGLTQAREHNSVLDLIVVADAMATNCATVSPAMPVADLASMLHEGNVRAYPVVGDDDRLVGIVTATDVEAALLAGAVAHTIVYDIMTRNVISCSPDQLLREVLDRITSQDVGQILVVDKANRRKLVGILSREEILWAYGELAVEHRRLLDERNIDVDSEVDESVQLEIEVLTQHEQLAFKKVRDIAVPDQSLIVLLRRANRVQVPRGETVVEPGDVLVLLTVGAHADALREWVADHTREAPPSA